MLILEKQIFWVENEIPRARSGLDTENTRQSDCITEAAGSTDLHAVG